MRRKKDGFALVELLAVIGIISVLAGVGVVNVLAQMRNMTKFQYDGYAREIFVAAQNHLTMAASQGYLGLADDEFGNYENPEETDVGVRYFVVKPRSSSGAVLDLILPKYAIDENTIGNGSCYLIRYDKDSAQILDVFYWTAPPGRFSHFFLENALEDRPADYEQFLTDKNVRDIMMNYGTDKAVIGYYGGAEAADAIPRSEPPLPPTLVVKNADRLEVTVTDTNPRDASGSGPTIKLIITGETSKELWGDDYEPVVLELNSITPGVSYKPNITVSYESDKTIYSIILDDVTNGNHFYKLHCDTGEPKQRLIPGENLIIQAVAFRTGEIAPPAYSKQRVTNSLFGDNTSVTFDKNEKKMEIQAEISSIRHLENLSPAISYVTKEIWPDALAVSVQEAKQTADLDWEAFYQAYRMIQDTPMPVPIQPITGTQTEVGCYMPVEPEYPLNYEGMGHSISNIRINSGDGQNNSGLFGTLGEGSTVKNLKLVDFSVTIAAGGSTGALAGSAEGTSFTNILACNSSDKDKTDTASADRRTITGPASTGGLIGNAANCTVTKCAAALLVRSTGGDAGGLIGTAEGTIITASYSGGHTKDGQYQVIDGDLTYSQNVSGVKNAGGLAGSFSGGAVQSSYSTCSACGGITAGGLLGFASGAAVEHCYAVGLVQSDSSSVGAFAGTFSGTADDCKYCEIINETAVKNDPEKGFECRPAFGSGPDSADVEAFDDDVSAYIGFVPSPSDRKPAIPYDGTLRTYYRGKYTFPAVRQLGYSDVSDIEFVSRHYGDWPAPEAMVKN